MSCGSDAAQGPGGPWEKAPAPKEKAKHGWTYEEPGPKYKVGWQPTPVRFRPTNKCPGSRKLGKRGRGATKGQMRMARRTGCYKAPKKSCGVRGKHGWNASRQTYATLRMLHRPRKQRGQGLIKDAERQLGGSQRAGGQREI